MRPEIGIALFAHSAATFFGLICFVHHTHSFKAQPTDATNAFAVGVEGALGDGNCCRAAQGQLLAPTVDFGVQLIVRYDSVDEAHGQRPCAE